MNGLKPVRARRDDALTQVNWQQLEVLLAVYYRGQGYQVEHVGTGATGARSDGGIDLKLRRAEEYVLVQVKHWNAYQVPHNDVHQLLGLMVNEGATGAVLVTSGEFTKEAIEAATRQGHVQLIDGAELRALLGPLPTDATERRTPMATRSNGTRDHGNTLAVSRRGDVYETANAFARAAGERLIDAAEDRIRYGRSGSSRARPAAALSLNLLLLKLGLGIVMVGLLWLAVRFALDSLSSSLIPPAGAGTTSVSAPMMPAVSSAAMQLRERDRAHTPHSPAVVAPRQQTAAEIRETQRKADEAIRVIEATTPEMY